MLFVGIKGPFLGHTKGSGGPKRDPRRPNGSHGHELCWLEHYMCLIAHSGPLLQPPRPKSDFSGPRTPFSLKFRGPFFGPMQFWSEHRHMGCPDCCNGIS